MRYPFIAGVALSAIATACSSVPAVKQPASPTAASSHHLTAMSHPAADEVEPQAQAQAQTQAQAQAISRSRARGGEGVGRFARRRVG